MLDRETGEFLLGKPFAKQTWAEGLDESGRPIPKPNTAPSDEGTTVAPPAGGAANYWSPSYSPRTGLIYVMAFDGEAKFFIRAEEYVAGIDHPSSTSAPVAGSRAPPKPPRTLAAC